MPLYTEGSRVVWVPPEIHALVEDWAEKARSWGPDWVLRTPTGAIHGRFLGTLRSKLMQAVAEKQDVEISHPNAPRGGSDSIHWGMSG